MKTPLVGPSPRATGEKVFGIGYPKTGTTTLGDCFQTLGYRHKSYDMALSVKFSRGDLAAVVAATEPYDTFEDWPWFLAYEVLDKAFPDARFVLTKRKNSTTYVNSLHEHFRREGAFSPDFQEPEWWQEVLGYPPGYWNSDLFKTQYEAHNKSVLSYFKDKPHKLLVVCWEKGDGWHELCAFLNKTVPEKSFPHLNKGYYDTVFS